MDNAWTEVGSSENIDMGEAGQLLLKVICGLFGCVEITDPEE
jgi:hypothetical protein